MYKKKHTMYKKKRKKKKTRILRLKLWINDSHSRVQYSTHNPSLNLYEIIVAYK
jgi:hypothetical protein